MEKVLLLLLLPLLLCGCKGETTETTAAAPTEDSHPTVAASEPTVPEPEDSDLVRVLDYIPTARQELMYATENNFTGKVIYDFSDAWLRYGTVKKLLAVSRDLEELGLYIKIWDGFRPVSAQFALWEVCPDPRYVADPNVRYSAHSRGNAVDLTLVDANGQELAMPTGYDDFTARADRDYDDCTPEEKSNAQILELLMEKHGFSGYKREWWHYADTDSYPVEEAFDPASVLSS